MRTFIEFETPGPLDKYDYTLDEAGIQIVNNQGTMMSPGQMLDVQRHRAKFAVLSEAIVIDERSDSVHARDFESGEITSHPRRYGAFVGASGAIAGISGLGSELINLAAETGSWAVDLAITSGWAVGGGDRGGPRGHGGPPPG